MTRAAWLAWALVLVIAACSPAENTPQTGSQTNWLRVCASSAECGDLECLCGTCTAACEVDAACAELPGASCVAASDEGAIALCGGRAVESSLCLPRCEETCAEGTSCIAGVCAPHSTPTAHVEIDPAMRHQTLVGFGASLAYADDAITMHPDKAALYDLVFERAGMDALRLRNRYEASSNAPIEAAREIIDAASARLGRTPFLFMTSGTPPAELKANGARTCAGDAQTCTLRTTPGAGFDYAGFADFWRASLDAYESAGVVPDYVSIQNNPNWIPPQAAPNEGCRFLPVEGLESVRVDGTLIEVAYPGYSEALVAVRAALAGLRVVPRFAAPEVSSVGDIAEYAAALDPASLDAFALHLYGQDAAAVDVAALETARNLAEQNERPVFQTEMRAEGLETAVLMHHALTAADASLYLQNDLVALTPAAADVSLLLLTPDRAEPRAPFYALAHFAKRTDPGWTRIEASNDETALLSSAWLSPDERALTVVLINSGAQALDAELTVPDALFAQLTRTEVTRTMFEGVERAADLGALSTEGVVRVPARSIVTIAFAAE
jgi:glucuronoarabinoxylan endo-1,4-beta-xylanase